MPNFDPRNREEVGEVEAASGGYTPDRPARDKFDPANPLRDFIPWEGSKRTPDYRRHSPEDVAFRSNLNANSGGFAYAKGGGGPKGSPPAPVATGSLRGERGNNR